MEPSFLNPLLFLLFGFCFGSFLNVLIDRIPKGQNFFKGRSRCDFCKRTLSPLELVPVLSFLILKGKCFSCGAPIPSRNLLVEFLTGVLFVFSYQAFGLTLLLFYILLIECSLISVFFIDLENGIIPDAITYPAIVVSIIYHLSFVYLFSAVGAGLFFFLIVVITKGRGMGFGDVKLVFLLGLVLGFPNIVLSLYLAFLTGAVLSLILVVRGQKNLKSAVPFGPFLAVSAVVTLFFGEKVLHLFPFL